MFAKHACDHQTGLVCLECGNLFRSQMSFECLSNACSNNFKWLRMLSTHGPCSKAISKFDFNQLESNFEKLRNFARKSPSLLKIIMIIMINAIALKIASNWPIFTENILLCTILVTGMLPHGNSKCNSHSTNWFHFSIRQKISTTSKRFNLNRWKFSRQIYNFWINNSLNDKPPGQLSSVRIKL